PETRVDTNTFEFTESVDRSVKLLGDSKERTRVLDWERRSNGRQRRDDTTEGR
ncbi:Hypothetical predicted protein, partial [Marmota monax]